VGGPTQGLRLPVIVLTASWLLNTVLASLAHRRELQPPYFCCGATRNLTPTPTPPQSSPRRRTLISAEPAVLTAERSPRCPATRGYHKGPAPLSFHLIPAARSVAGLTTLARTCSITSHCARHWSCRQRLQHPRHCRVMQTNAERLRCARSSPPAAACRP